MLPCSSDVTPFGPPFIVLIPWHHPIGISMHKARRQGEQLAEQDIMTNPNVYAFPGFLADSGHSGKRM